jgi:hypothetical protein
MSNICALMSIPGLKKYVTEFMDMESIVSLLLTCKVIFKELGDCGLHKRTFTFHSISHLQTMYSLCLPSGCPGINLDLKSKDMKKFAYAPDLVYDNIYNMQMKLSPSKECLLSMIFPCLSSLVVTSYSADETMFNDIYAPNLTRAIIISNFNMCIEFLHAGNLQNLTLVGHNLDRYILGDIATYFPSLQVLSLTSANIFNLSRLGSMKRKLKKLSIDTDARMCNQYVWHPLSKMKNLDSLFMKGHFCRDCAVQFNAPIWPSTLKNLSLTGNFCIPVDWFHKMISVEHIELKISTPKLLDYMYLFPNLKTLNLKCLFMLKTEQAKQQLRGCKKLSVLNVKDSSLRNRILTKVCWPDTIVHVKNMFL